MSLGKLKAADTENHTYQILNIVIRYLQDIDDKFGWIYQGYQRNKLATIKNMFFFIIKLSLHHFYFILYLSNNYKILTCSLHQFSF